MRAGGSAGSSKRCTTESDSIPRYDISHRKSSSSTARLAEVTALMEAMENQRTVYHRSHRPWKSLRDYHTPAARRLLIHNEASTRPRVSPINRPPACLNLGVQSRVIRGHDTYFQAFFIQCGRYGVLWQQTQLLALDLGCRFPSWRAA